MLRAMLASAEYEDVLPMAGYVWEQLCAIAVDRAEPDLVRERALWAVVLPCIGKARREIAEILDDPQAPAGLRQLATVGAGRCRARRALERLVERAATAESGDSRRAAITSLGQLRSPRALAPLLALWAEADAETRGVLRLALRRLCSVSGARLLAEWLEGAARPEASLYAIDDALRLDLAPAAGDVRRLLADPDPGARRDALLLLAWLGAREDAAALEPLAQSDPDPELRRLAQLGRARLASLPASPR
jgi:HEAT repeat protein